MVITIFCSIFSAYAICDVYAEAICTVYTCSCNMCMCMFEAICFPSWWSARWSAICVCLKQTVQSVMRGSRYAIILEICVWSNLFVLYLICYTCVYVIMHLMMFEAICDACFILVLSWWSRYAGYLTYVTPTKSFKVLKFGHGGWQIYGSQRIAFPPLVSYFTFVPFLHKWQYTATKHHFRSFIAQ